jgi:LysM repeat protein
MPNKKNSKGYSRSLSATNKLFTQNFLFAKPKSRKNKVFDPNSKYYAEGGEPCPGGKQIYPEYKTFGCISLSQYNNLIEQTKANEKKQKLYKETLLKEQSALKASINDPELHKKLYAEYKTKYPGQSSVCPNGKCPVDDLVLEPEVENLPILKPGLIEQEDSELQDNTLNEEVESEYLEEGSPDTDNPMEWVNKRKHYIDWNGTSIAYKLPRFRKPGSYGGGLIRPGKQRYFHLPTIESRNTAYLRPKKQVLNLWQDGGLHKFVDGGKPCSDEEYWDGENCVPKEKDSSPIMQNPSWQQEPVVNSAAYVSGYRGDNPKISKYSFLNSDQGNIIGGGGLSFPKSGINLNATGVVPVSSNNRQYFKGAYEANVSKDFKNLNLGLGVNTAITGYPGENGFVKDPIKFQPKLNLRYNFQKGGTWSPNPDFFPKKNNNTSSKTQNKVTTPIKNRWGNVTVESNDGKPNYRKDDYIDMVQSKDPKTKAEGLKIQAEHQKQLKDIQAKEQAEIIKQRELLYQQMLTEDKEQLIKLQNKPLLVQISETNKYTPIGEKPKPFIPYKKPGLMEIPIDYESTPRAIASKDERINMFIDKKKKDYLNQTIKKNGADIILSLQDEYMKKVNSDKKFRDSNISYDDYLLEKLNDPTYKYKDELLKIYKQKYNENTNFIQKGFDNVADFLSDPLNSLENDIWEGENGRIPQSRFIVRDPNSPFYDATNERLQYDSSPLNSMLNYINPFSSAAEANVDYSKGNYSDMFGNLAEIPFKAVGALAAPEVLSAVTALPVMGTTVGTLLNAGFVGLGTYEAVEGPLANNISEAVTSGLSNDWRKAINEGLLVSSYFLGLGEVSEAIALYRLNNIGKAKNFLPLTLQQYRDLRALSKAKPLQQVSALQKFTDSKIATDAEIIDINNISKPVQSLVDGTVSQRTIPQMMKRPALPEPNNIYQQANFVSDNPGLNAADYLKPNVISNRAQAAADFNVIDDFNFSEFGTLSAEEIAALRQEMAEADNINTSRAYDDPVNSNLENDMNSFIPTVTNNTRPSSGYPLPPELIIPEIPFNGAANSVNMNLFPGYNSSGVASSIQSPWEASFNNIDESFKALKEYIIDNNIGNGVGDGQDMLKLMEKAGIDESAIQSIANSFNSNGYNYSIPNLNELEFGSFIHDVAIGIVPLEISPLLPDAINAVIPYLRGNSASISTAAPRTYLGNINSYKPKTVTHTFKNGETLESLAKQYNVPERSLLVENRISSIDELNEGQEIVISKQKPLETGSYEFTLAQQNMGNNNSRQGMHTVIDETLKDSNLAKDFKLDIKSATAKTDAKEMKNVLKDLMKDDAYDAEIYKKIVNGKDEVTSNGSAYVSYGNTGTKDIYKLKDLNSIIKTEDLDKSIKYTKKAYDLLNANKKTLDLNQLKLLRSLQIKLYDLYGTNYIRNVLPIREGITDEKILSELNGLSMQNKGLQAPVGHKNIINKEGEVIATIQIGHMDQGVVISQTGLKLKYHGYNWKHDVNPLTGLKFQSKDEALAALTQRLKLVTGEMVQNNGNWGDVYRGSSPISEAEASKEAKKIMENLDFNNKVGYGKALYGMVNYAAEQMGFGKLMTEAHFAETTFPSPVTGKPVPAYRARNLWESQSTTNVDGKPVRRFLKANEVEGDRSGRNFYMNYKKGGDPSKLKMFI